MKLLNNLVIIVFLFFIYYPAKGQNIFDAENSRKYADYLFLSGDFKLAAEEYERLLFLLPQNDTFVFRLIKSCRNSGEISKANERLNGFYASQQFPLRETMFEYLILQLKLEQYDNIRINLQKFSMIAPDEKLFFRISTELFSDDFDKAKTILTDWAGPLPEAVLPYETIINDYFNIHFKSPFIGGSLSAILPGLGQVYSGYWKDGIFAFLFTASSAYQSFRGFSKTGIKSPYGWIYGAMGTGFYIGNIYGASKAANKYNFKKKEEIENRIEKVFTTYYP